MAGWRKAWLSVLDRPGSSGGGGSTGSLQAHLNGILSPSSSSSSLATKRGGSGAGGGKRGGGHVSTKAVLACFSAVLVLAFFYVSITSGPTADGSFPSPSSSSGALLSSSNSSSPKKPLPPRPPIPSTEISSGGSAQQSSGSNATVEGPRRVPRNGGDWTTPGLDSGQPLPVLQQTAKEQGALLSDGNAAVAGSEGDPAVSNGTTRAQEPQEVLITAMPPPPPGPWRRADGASSTEKLIVGGASDEPADTDGAPGNSTYDTLSWGKEVGNTNASIVVDNVPPNSTRQAAALPSTAPPDQRKEDNKHSRHRRAYTARHKQRSTRRRKDIIFPVPEQEGAGAELHSDGAPDLAGANNNTSVALGPGNHRVVWTSGVQKNLVSFAKCDVFSGGWVREEGYAFYPPGSCPLIDDDFNCHKNGRQDTDFLNWRWQPSGCDIPRCESGQS